MKSRLFFQALCVGVALLVPASGLIVLAAGTGEAGASTTTLSFGSPSTLTFGSLGSASLSGATAKETGDDGQYFLTDQASITSTLKALLTAQWLVTHTGSTITAVKTKKDPTIVLKGTGDTHCAILTMIALTFSPISGKWTISGISLSSVIINTVSGTCTNKTAIASDLGGSNRLSGSLVLSLT